MKKQHILITIVLVSSFPFVSYGAESEQSSFSITSWIKGIKDAIVLKLEDNKGEMRRYHEEKTREVQEALAKITDIKKETIEESLTSSMKLRTEETLKKFANISERLQTRVDKLNKSGIDTKEAKEKIKEANSAREDAFIQYELLIWNTDDQEVLKRNDEIMAIVRDDINIAHKNFTEAIQLLKEAQGKLDAKIK